MTLRIADLEDDGPTLQDAAGTWLLGHTERLTFGRPYVRDRELLVDTVVHVPCRHLETKEIGAGHGARCAVHGFEGPVPQSTQREREVPRRAGGRTRVFYKGKSRVLDLPVKRAARRTLPVLNDNPCAGAACRTADNTRGAACCRDLTLEILLPRGQRRLESLLRTRKSPYLCKVTREDDDSVECEVISACGYLDDDGVSCVLHDRTLPNGRLAKPSICREWPSLDDDETTHPGCRFA